MLSRQEVKLVNKTNYRDEASDITMTQQGRDMFTVRYGKQVRTKLRYSEAATELGSCIMHFLACEGRLDNSMPGDHS